MIAIQTPSFFLRFNFLTEENSFGVMMKPGLQSLTGRTEESPEEPRQFIHSPGFKPNSLLWGIAAGLTLWDHPQTCLNN